MKRLADLSYRIKIPLAISAIIVLTEVVVTAALLTRAFRDAQVDLEASARNLATVVGRSLRGPMVRDDLWQAFEVIRTPLAARAPDNSLQAIVVLDASYRVYVSSDPERIQIQAPASSLPTALAELAETARGSTEFRFVFGSVGENRDVVATGPVLADDGTFLGSVMLSFDADRYFDRVRGTLFDLAAISIPGLLVLIPLGWIWGERMVKPLGRLAEALGRVGRDSAGSVAASLSEGGGDEIGALSRRARLMLDELARKEQLEREMLKSERLAAVGRLSAALAHEINNPLGGMLNAIDTLSRHGNPDPFTRKTLGLLQRGLQQIRSTVGALLVEARHDSPAIGLDDWQDLRTLIEPQLAARGVSLGWSVETIGEVRLPAHQVRQLVLNLLLNGVKFANTGGHVGLKVAALPAAIAIEVTNSGAPIPAAVMDHLFEPFVAATERDGKRTYGIGLWVCYQIVQQLRGSISAATDAGWTRFLVTLPVPQERATEA